MIKIKKANKLYNENLVLKNLNFSIESGNTYCLVGKNGSGKTTLINLILGIIKLNKGSIETNLNFKYDIGVMLQDDIFPQNIKVNEMINMHLSIYKKKKDFSQINTLLKKINLEGKINEYVTNLSGGQKRKLSFILSIIHNPKFIILDEPTTGMDFESIEQFIDIIKQLKKENKTILLITHDFYQIDEFVDEIDILRNGYIQKKYTVNEIKEQKVIEYGIVKESLTDSSDILFSTDTKVVVNHENKQSFEESNYKCIKGVDTYLRNLEIRDIFKSLSGEAKNENNYSTY